MPGTYWCIDALLLYKAGFEIRQMCMLNAFPDTFHRGIPGWMYTRGSRPTVCKSMK
jgi:hypothetical protein